LRLLYQKTPQGSQRLSCRYRGCKTPKQDLGLTDDAGKEKLTTP